MSEEIAKVIDALAEKLAVPAQFVTQELLRYKLAESIVWLVFGIIASIAGWLVFKYSFKMEKDEWDGMSLPAMFVATAGVIGIVAGGGAVMNSFGTLVKILIAPTGYIITYILRALK